MADCVSEDDLYRERLPNICHAVGSKAKKCCSTDTLKRTLPICNWISRYKLKYLLNDFVAGLTVGLTTVPQAIAYGSVVGLSPQYGLYSAFMGCFVYIFFGTCKDITVGPTAIMALLTKQHVHGSADYTVLLCFLTGCIILVLGLLNLGVLVRFISIPVTSGFTMAAAITIASGQINNLFGISSQSNDFLPAWINFFKNIKSTKRNDAILGICTLTLLLIMRKVKDIPCPWRNLAKYVSLSRNALAVIIGILLCYFLKQDESLPFRVNDHITAGIPPFKPPPFSTIENGVEVGFSEMVSNLGAALISIPLVSILESIAVAKAFSKGKVVDATQEMIALGMCNFFSSFVSSIPITGSFTRTAINNASGVQTPLGGAFTGALVLATLAFLTSTFSYIPKATLAAIIIAAMIFMIEYDRIGEIWRAKKSDMIPFIVTVACCLFWSLDYGMVCGIFFNLLFILYKSMKPVIQVTADKISDNEVCLVTVKGSIDYAAAEYVKTLVVHHVTAHKNHVKFVVFAGAEITTIDSTVALNICSLKEDLALLDCRLICWNWTVAAAGVICRVHKDLRALFQFTKTFADIDITDGAANKADSFRELAIN